MNTKLLCLTLPVAIACVSAGCTGSHKAGRAKAVAEIEKLGGRVVFDDEKERLAGTVLSDDEKLDKPVVRVVLEGPKVTDASLHWLMPLADVECLHLSGARVTDAGLERLKAFKRLRELDLSGTPITDAGLEHLKGMTLGRVDLTNTKVTDAAVEALRRALQHGEPVYPDVRH